MSSDDTGEQVRQAGGQKATEVAEYLTRATGGAVQQRLRSVSGTCRLNIADAGDWLVTIKEGVATLAQNGTNTPSADCTVESDAEEFLRVVRREGNMNLFAAYLQGRVTITGDLGFATALLGSVTLDPVASVGEHSTESARQR